MQNAKEKVEEIINQDRLVQEFMELVKIPSESGKEGKVARVVKEKLETLGLTVREDKTGELTGGEAGNIIATLESSVPPGEKSDKPALLLSSHLDTVAPGEHIVPVVDHDIIRSAGDTILGADAKAGVAAILEALRVIREQRIPHPALVIVLTVAEEMGLLGASHLDPSMFRAEMGFVLDSFGQVGGMATRGPAHSRITAVIKGKPAHAGNEPEAGVNAIKIAAEAISLMKLGRIDTETTANIGTINGGRATNIVPDEVTIVGEVRSTSPEKLEEQNNRMKQAFLETARRGGGEAQVDVRLSYPQIDLPDDAPVVETVRKAGEAMNLEMRSFYAGGGSDANIFNKLGIPTVNLTSGMEKVHTNDEYIRVEDLCKLSRLVVEIVRQV